MSCSRSRRCPRHADWAKALVVAGDTFGLALPGRALHADNLKRFEALLQERLKACVQPCAELPGALRGRLGDLGEADATDRVRTAISADALCAALNKQRALQQIEVLAGAVLETSAKAVGRSIGSAADNGRRARSDALVFGVFGQLVARGDEVAGAADAVLRVKQALRQDELNAVLAPQLRALAVEGQRILLPTHALAPVPTPPGVVRRPFDATGRPAVLAALREALASVEAAAAEDDVRVQGAVTITKGKRP